jgi:hypothetical protein
MPIAPHPQYEHTYWAIWPISLQLRGAIVPFDGKANGERKEAMIARFDRRPRLTAALALATMVLVVVVVTLSVLLITAAPQAVAPTSGSVGENTPVIGAGGEHYGDEWNNYGHDFDQPKPAQTGNGVDEDALARHAAMVEAFNDNR